MRNASGRARSLALLVALTALIVTACASGTAAPSAGLTVNDAWVRAAPSGSTETAAYLTITNSAGQADRLTLVSSPSMGNLELMSSTTDASGMSGMNMMDGIDIPAGGTVSLAPGGLHVMVTNMSKPLNVGDRIELNLTFEKAGMVKVMAEVRQG